MGTIRSITTKTGKVSIFFSNTTEFLYDTHKIMIAKTRSDYLRDKQLYSQTHIA